MAHGMPVHVAVKPLVFRAGAALATEKRGSRMLRKKGFTVKSEAAERKANPRVSSEVSQVWAWRE